MSAPSPLQFVDTNILVYAQDSTAGHKHRVAQELMRELWRTKNGCLSIQVLQEFYVVVTRKVARPLSSEAAADIIADLGVWTVYRPGVEDVLEAIQLHGRYQIAYWDAMILTCAARLGCATLWSEDLNLGQSYNGVVVANPF